MGREERINFVEMPEVLRGKYQYYTKAEIGKIRAAGYHRPVQTLEEGVAAYIPYLNQDERILGW
jgi:ADP-L-glycero-D-manno-heptose 6-epimerase